MGTDLSTEVRIGVQDCVRPDQRPRGAVPRVDLEPLRVCPERDPRGRVRGQVLEPRRQFGPPMRIALPECRSRDAENHRESENGHTYSFHPEDAHMIAPCSLNRPARRAAVTRYELNEFICLLVS